MTDTLEARMTTNDRQIEELVDILCEVQQRLRRTFDPVDVFDILTHTIRKCEFNKKDESYIPVLFKNELEDFVMREKINLLGRMNLCARSAV